MTETKRLNPGRVIFSLAVVVVVFYARFKFVGREAWLDQVGPVSWFGLEWMLRPGPWALLFGLHVVAASLFALRRFELAAGSVAFVVLGLHASADMSMRQVVMPNAGLALMGPLLAAWLVGQALWRGRTSAERDRNAQELLFGVFGAVLFLAAWAKLAATGPGWIDGRTHCLVIFENSLDDVGFTGGIRRWVAHHPWMCSAGTVFAWVIEFCGIAMIFERARLVVAVAVSLMFVSFAAVLGIYEIEWILVPPALAIWGLAGNRS